LRFISSKDVEKLIAYVNGLPYRIEIKGAPIFAEGKWVLFFIPPDEDQMKEAVFGDLD
jgi:hypothetical protein